MFHCGFLLNPRNRGSAAPSQVIEISVDAKRHHYLLQKFVAVRDKFVYKTQFNVLAAVRESA
jgi:hypothetical protein